MSTTDKNSNRNKNSKSYDSEITKDDIQAIGKKGLRADSEDDKLLLKRKKPVDFEGKNLDIPERNDSTTKKDKPLKDEENTLYAQGSAHNENLEAPERANTNKE